MVKALAWNDVQSFKQHLEHMRMFRQMHRSDGGRLAPLNDMPTPGNARPPNKAGGARGATSIKGGAPIVPIWKIAPPRNSQN
jgi:hypothetical protein